VTRTSAAPPPIAFIIVGDQILLHLHRSDPQNPANSIEVGQFPVANGLARGSWHDFQMDVRWDLTNGWVTVWHNGQLMQHHGPIQTLFPQQQNPGAAGSTYLKMGLYRKAVPTATAGDFVLYHDEVQRFDASFAPVYQQGDPGTGIGGYDLARPSDRIFAFDFNSSGKLDHLVLYRPGTGTVWILGNSGGQFAPVYQQGDPGAGIGGYDLARPSDRIFAFDYNRSGRQDHLVLHRPGTGTIWILRNLGGRFAPIYQQGDPGSGIGGYDLARASDRVLAFDYDGSGRQDHLVLYRPGTGTIWILR
jgi:hypothetical protein